MKRSIMIFTVSAICGAIGSIIDGTNPVILDVAGRIALLYLVSILSVFVADIFDDKR